MNFNQVKLYIPSESDNNFTTLIDKSVMEEIEYQTFWNIDNFSKYIDEIMGFISLRNQGYFLRRQISAETRNNIFQMLMPDNQIKKIKIEQQGDLFDWQLYRVAKDYIQKTNPINFLFQRLDYPLIIKGSISNLTQNYLARNKFMLDYVKTTNVYQLQ